MSTSRADGVMGLAAVGLAVCCGLPLLLAASASVVIAGVALRLWLFAAVGVVAVAIVLARRQQHRSTRRSGASDGERS